MTSDQIYSFRDQDDGAEADEDFGFFDEEFDEADELPDRYRVPEVEDLIEEAIEALAAARPLPMSATVKVNRDDLLVLLEQALERLPEELRAARWLLKERDDFVAKARLEHQELIEEGRRQVARMVEREQVVTAAEHRAREIIAQARDEANTMGRQVEEFCEQRLASIELIMAKTTETMQRGRERLVGMSESVSEQQISSEFSRPIDLEDASNRVG